MTNPVWPLPPDHPYALTEEERWALRAAAAGAMVFYDYDAPLVERLCEGRLADDEGGLLPPFVTLRITDAGRQALELHRAMEGRE